MAETHFVRRGYEVFKEIIEEKSFCRNYLEQLISLIESLLPMIENVREMLNNLLQKACAPDKSDAIPKKYVIYVEYKNCVHMKY